MTVVDNQAAIGRSLHEAGCVGSLGWHADLAGAQVAGALDLLLRDTTGRTRLSERGRALVDGRGAERVVAALRSAETTESGMTDGYGGGADRN